MRFLLSIIGVVVFIVLVIVIIASSNSSKPIGAPINLDNYNYPESSVTQISTGELVSDSQRIAIQITVTQSQASIYILNTYLHTVVKSESFANNSTAYGVFLGGLQNAAFTDSRRTNEVNMFGVCPLGDTYQYQLNNGTKTVSNLWSTSCSFSDGTFAGNGPLIRQLFTLQIPNFNTFTSGYNNTYINSIISNQF